MYYFNKPLLTSLPELFNSSFSGMSEGCGLGPNTVMAWVTRNNMTVAKFVDFLNFYHLSMADFLVLSPAPLIKKDKVHYIVPKEIWKPVQWKNENLRSLCGDGSLTGMSMEAVAKSLGFASYAPIVNWITEPYSMKMTALINLLNTYRLDANILISDPNKTIGVPESWLRGGNSRTNESVMGLDRKMEHLVRQVKDRDALISSLKLEVDRLKRENEALRASGPVGMDRSGFVAESVVPYGRPSKRERYVFHKELLGKLTEVFGITQKDFCDRFGISPSQIKNGNIKMDNLIGVCNGLHMSITHFFPPQGEPLVVNHRSWYEIPDKLFKPISSRMENIKYLFRKTTSGYTLGQLKRETGISENGLSGFTEETGKRRMVLFVLEICNSFNLPLSSFVSDPNDCKRPSYSGSLNETLIENCVNMAKELEKYRKTVRKLKEKSEGKGRED